MQKILISSWYLKAKFPKFNAKNISKKFWVEIYAFLGYSDLNGKIAILKRAIGKGFGVITFT